ncbi:type II toxin-antitoxin system RelE/ParE family toxin [Bradyrhizobium sp. SRS-191]|uniref:type II toxin-antitoxin system RelE/ParE family toxin n=1 Tax=Bradyrhizobium sp. SRS-191 TaxID=2962606 RepID=UPI0035BBE6FB
MRVVYPAEAISDLADIADWLVDHYPTVAQAVEQRIKRVVAHIARWPSSARRVVTHRDVRAVPLGRYPYTIFYRIKDDTIEILHIHHAAQQPWLPED